MGTAVLSGTPTVVSGTTYRYGFTGDFVDRSDFDEDGVCIIDISGTPRFKGYANAFDISSDGETTTIKYGVRDMVEVGITESVPLVDQDCMHIVAGVERPAIVHWTLKQEVDKVKCTAYLSLEFVPEFKD